MDYDILFGLFLNEYLSEKQFEKLLFVDIDQLEKEVERDLFLDLISTNYSNRVKCISLIKKLEKYMHHKNAAVLETLNDAYVEKRLENQEWGIYTEFINERYEIVDSIEIDCSQINSLQDMHKKIKTCLKFPSYYGENWDALNDLLSDTKLPSKLKFIDWSGFEDNFQEDANILKKIMEKIDARRCQISFM